MKSMSAEAALLIPHFWLVVLFVAVVVVLLFLLGVSFLRITRHMQSQQQQPYQPSPESKITPLGYYSVYHGRQVAPQLHKRTRRLTRELAENATVEIESVE